MDADTGTRLARITPEHLAALQHAEAEGGRHSLERVLDGIHMSVTHRIDPEALAKARAGLPVPPVVQGIQRRRQQRKLAWLWHNLRRWSGWWSR
jgi:hypothetical protein